jgi:hypothetical protein
MWCGTIQKTPPPSVTSFSKRAARLTAAIDRRHGLQGRDTATVSIHPLLLHD